MEISVKLEAFEGPLDLLLHLIEKNRVSIYDIPIVEITSQYMSCLRSMEGQNLDILSDFLVMAATLLDIKCRMLLPAEENEEGETEDPRTELVERLLEYKMYRYASENLKGREGEAERALYKAPTIPEEVSSYQAPVDLDALLDGVTLSRLQSVFDFVMKRREDKVARVRSRFGKIPKDPVKVEDKILEIMTFGTEHGSFDFQELLESQATRVEIVVTFQAILELLKLGRLEVQQDHLFDTIHLTLVDATPVTFEEAAGGEGEGETLPEEKEGAGNGD